MEQYRNEIILVGRLKDLPVPSHENHGVRFCRFTLEVARISGTVDSLPCVADFESVRHLSLSEGCTLRVAGEIRTHNIRNQAAGRKLMIFVFVRELEHSELNHDNHVHVGGIVCKEPIFRHTPMGRQICDVMLAVPRAYHRADYLPCILWGRTAQEGAMLHVRDTLEIIGRLQSRIYFKNSDDGPVEHTAYEISALSAQ